MGYRWFEGDHQASLITDFQDVHAITPYKGSTEPESLHWTYHLTPECFDGAGNRVLTKQQTMATLKADRPYLCRMRVSDFETGGGPIMDWRHLVKDPEGRHGIFIKERYGVEEVVWGEWKRRYYRETTHIGALTVTWKPSLPDTFEAPRDMRLRVPTARGSACQSEQVSALFMVH